MALSTLGKPQGTGLKIGDYMENNGAHMPLNLLIAVNSNCHWVGAFGAPLVRADRNRRRFNRGISFRPFPSDTSRQPKIHVKQVLCQTSDVNPEHRHHSSFTNKLQHVPSSLWSVAGEPYGGSLLEVTQSRKQKTTLTNAFKSIAKIH